MRIHTTRTVHLLTRDIPNPCYPYRDKRCREGQSVLTSESLTVGTRVVVTRELHDDSHRPDHLRSNVDFYSVMVSFDQRRDPCDPSDAARHDSPLWWEV